MKFVYILEKDRRFINEILESLQKIDPKLEARIFIDLESFAKWIQVLSKDGVSAISKGGIKPINFDGLRADLVGTPLPEGAEAAKSTEADQLVLMISDNDILGSKHLPLLKKTQALFVQKGLCTKEDPTAIVISAFDNPGFEIETVEDRIINNVIFKPFEKLILLQHLIFAISGRHPPSNNTLHNMKTSAIIEMLKDVEVEACSDIGFITLSSRPLPVGAVSKYYSDVFKSGKTRNAFARCTRCEPHPTLAEVFRSAFTFFGVEPEQLIDFRKNAPLKNELEFDFKWRPEQSANSVHIVVIDPDEFGPAPLAGSLERSFSNVKIVAYKSMGEFLVDLDPALQTPAVKPAPAFPGGVKMKLQFEVTSKKLIKTIPEVTAAQTLLGFFPSELQKLEFFQWMLGQERNKLLEMVKGTMNPLDDKILTLNNKDQDYFIRLESHQNLKDGVLNTVELTFAELTEAERQKWQVAQSRMPEKVDGILVHEQFLREDDLTPWNLILERLKKRVKATEQAAYKPELMVLAKHRKNDTSLRLLGKVFSNIFYKPVERSYFLKMMYLQIPSLNPTSPIEIKQYVKKEKFEVGNTIQVTEMSEAGLVMNYYRAITVGSFRRFILWFPMEIGQPVMLATCNFNKENEAEKGLFENHFVFFGMQDIFLQHVRVWIRENYVLSKQGQEP